MENKYSLENFLKMFLGKYKESTIKKYHQKADNKEELYSRMLRNTLLDEINNEPNLFLDYQFNHPISRISSLIVRKEKGLPLFWLHTSKERELVEAFLKSQEFRHYIKSVGDRVELIKILTTYLEEKKQHTYIKKKFVRDSIYDINIAINNVLNDMKYLSNIFDLHDCKIPDTLEIKTLTEIKNNAQTALEEINFILLPDTTMTSFFKELENFE